uniref:Uncharacterized protein n=1 Tax=Micrurus surinamensis TaxID=129470 RepID=A0A2D4NKH4_MICSU
MLSEKVKGESEWTQWFYNLLQDTLKEPVLANQSAADIQKPFQATETVGLQPHNNCTGTVKLWDLKLTDKSNSMNLWEEDLLLLMFYTTHSITGQIQSAPSFQNSK